MSSRHFAEIIIPLALPMNYTWAMPDEMVSMAKPGCRVEVVLGKNKKYAGIIKRIHTEKPDSFDPKDIINLLDQEPIVHEEQLQLWEWMSSYYLCSEGEIMAAALPSHFKLSSESIIVFNEEYGEDFSALDHDEFLLAEALLIKKQLKIGEVQDVLSDTNAYPVLKRLIDKRVCSVWESLKETFTVKKETYITLAAAYENEEKLADLMNNWSKAPRQLELLLSYLHIRKTQGQVTKPELLKKSGATDAQLKGLMEKNVLQAEKRRVDRIQYLPRDITIDFTLSEAQQAAMEQVHEAFEAKQVCLLHGVTSSGKTQVYIRLIENVIRRGKQVLYLLPEIALTSQIIRRLQKHFGGYIGIYHSKFNQNERVEIWSKVRSGELKILLGARSSLFLPFSDLGLVIVDEEHDTSFKQQEPAPRYHARDAAIYYASLFDARVLLGSATPSMESYYNAVHGKYRLVELNERYGGLEMPLIEIVDTKKNQFLQKEKSMVTTELQEAIKQAVEQERQVILFQNRRGYTPYQLCQVCGWIPNCRYCDVSLTFHKHTNKLHCHYCGTVYPPLNTCLACGSSRFIQKNFGTQKVEEQLQELFPGLNISRMDIDSVRGKHAHETMIQQFEEQRTSLLVGTQMVVKGLDFENVQLVGIVDADSLLSFTDFRVNERAFQLMEQVSGRAGRREGRGRVMIQVANTAHPVLEYVRQHSYKLFFESEIESRKRFFYPPFSRLIKITFKHVREDLAEECALAFVNNFDTRFRNQLIGPAQPVVNRVRNQFLREVLFKLPKDSRVLADCRKAIHAQTASLQSQKQFRSVVITPDADPG